MALGRWGRCERKRGIAILVLRARQENADNIEQDEVAILALLEERSFEAVRVELLGMLHHLWRAHATKVVIGQVFASVHLVARLKRRLQRCLQTLHA